LEKRVAKGKAMPPPVPPPVEGATSRQPTRYERELMGSLGFETLTELIEFLALPPHPGLSETMHPPDTSESTRWDNFVDEQWNKEQEERTAEVVKVPSKLRLTASTKRRTAVLVAAAWCSWCCLHEVLNPVSMRHPINAAVAAMLLSMPAIILGAATLWIIGTTRKF